MMSSDPSKRFACRANGTRALLVMAGAVMLVGLTPGVASAQDAPATNAKGKARAADSSAALQRRVEQLEEQLVDMQVTIRTLESLARAGGARGGAPAAGGGLGAGDAARLEGMETQIRALSSEVQRLTNQVRQMGGGGDRGDAQGSVGLRSDYASQEPAPPTTTDIPSTFGSTTVTSGQGRDPIGSLIDARPAAARTPVGAAGARVAALPPAQSNASAKQDYETAYGHLLRQDYGAAEAAFDEFLNVYPNDQLAGNAQYWLGETHFVRGSYKSAASAFLKGYQTYAKSNKAPDSLLKLAMSLDRLGQKDAACSSFGELVTRFPDAPGHVKDKAAAEQRRLKCR